MNCFSFITTFKLNEWLWLLFSVNEHQRVFDWLELNKTGCEIVRKRQRSFGIFSIGLLTLSPIEHCCTFKNDIKIYFDPKNTAKKSGKNFDGRLMEVVPVCFGGFSCRCHSCRRGSFEHTQIHRIILPGKAYRFFVVISFFIPQLSLLSLTHKLDNKLRIYTRKWIARVAHCCVSWNVGSAMIRRSRCIYITALICFSFSPIIADVNPDRQYRIEMRPNAPTCTRSRRLIDEFVFVLREQ